MGNEKKDRLVRGSIRVFKDAMFYEERVVQQINISYKGLNAILHLTSIPKDLQKIFEEAEIVWNPDTHDGYGLKSDIRGISFDEIESAGEDHLRIKFSGLTESALQTRLQEAINWLNEHNISHGEKDGKVACIFKCLTSKQLEVGEL